MAASETIGYDLFQTLSLKIVCFFLLLFVDCLASLAFWWRLWLLGFSGVCGFLASVAFWLLWPFSFLRLVCS